MNKRERVEVENQDEDALFRALLEEEEEEEVPGPLKLRRLDEEEEADTRTQIFPSATNDLVEIERTNQVLEAIFQEQAQDLKNTKPPEDDPDQLSFDDDADYFDGEVEDDDEDPELGTNSAAPSVDPNEDYLSDKYIVKGDGALGDERERIRRKKEHEPDTYLEDFLFQHTETTYGINLTTKKPQVRLWGLTQKGASVCVLVDGFHPYSYWKCDTDQEVKDLIFRLENYMRREKRKSEDTKFVVGYERVTGRSVYGYERNCKKETLYKVTMTNPSYVAFARDCLEKANPAVTTRRIETFEANIPFELRYMVDFKLYGCGWMSLKKGCYVKALPGARISPCEYEFIGNTAACLEPKPEKDDLAPMRYLSYDIEVWNVPQKGFPSAKRGDPVIIIAAGLHEVGTEDLTIHQVKFCVRPPDKTKSFLPAKDCTTYVYDHEAQAILAFMQYIKVADPEAFTGWNTNNFDMPYLYERAEILGIKDHFTSFARNIANKIWLRRSNFNSKANGARVTVELLCEGRFGFDGLLYFLRGGGPEKYRSYKLNHISKKILDDQKLDVDHTQIPRLYLNESDHDRTRLSDYCLKDALLPLRILHAIMANINSIAQARVTGVSIKWLLSRGQGIKIMSAFLRAKADDEHVPSKTPKANKLYTAGGYVKHPLENFYKDKPVVTLDFNSLYPNVMIAKNMCYTTECSLEYARKHLPPGSYYQPFPAVDDPKETEREIGKSKKDLKRERKDNVMEDRKEHFFEKGKVNTTDKEGRKPNKKNKKKHDREQDEMISRFGGKPCNYVFVQPEIREGILTQLLKMLLKARADVRALQKKEKKGSLRWLVLEGQQLAFKVVANSVYGFVKAFMLCMIEIMSAVTAEGRHMNYYVQHIVNTEFQDLDVVDVKRCRAMGLDPEEEPKPGEPDPRPRRKKAAYVVYGDTDSVMICFGRVTVADAYRWGKIVRDRCDAACKARFGANHNLEFESVKFNFLLMKKKRYASYEVLSGHKPGEKLVDMMKKGKVTAKGIESKRRDNAPIGGNTQGEVLDILVGKGDIEGAEEHVKNKIRALLSAEIDMSELVITQGLSKTEEDYKKSKAKLRHVALRDRIKKRSRFTGEDVPETGDRVPYVMVKKGLSVSKTSKNATKAYEKSENPVYALKNKLPIDTDYYIQGQMIPALLRVFTCVYEPERCKEVESNMSLNKLRTFKAYQKLFSPELDHMNVRKKQKVDQKNSSSDSIAKWTVALPQCQGCGARVARKGQPVCSSCDRSKVHFKKLEEGVHLTVKREVYWKQCRDCQGPLFGKVTCSEMTCENFFRRDRVLSDIEDLFKDLKQYE